MLETLEHHSAGILLVAIASLLLVMQLIETHPHLAWLLDGFGKRVVKDYEQRQDKRREALIAEAHILGLEIVSQIMPDDYENFKYEIQHAGERIHRICGRDLICEQDEHEHS